MKTNQSVKTTVSLNRNEIEIALIRQACLPLCGSNVEFKVEVDGSGFSHVTGAEVSCNCSRVLLKKSTAKKKHQKHPR